MNFVPKDFNRFEWMCFRSTKSWQISSATTCPCRAMQITLSPRNPFEQFDRKVREVLEVPEFWKVRVVLDHLDLESSRVLESSRGFGSLGPGRAASEGLTGWKQVRRSSVGLPGPSLTLRCGRWEGDTPSICICKLYLYCIFISYLYLYLYFYYMGGSRAPSFSVAGGRQDRHGRLVLQLRKYRNHPQLLPLYRHKVCNISKYKYK